MVRTLLRLRLLRESPAAALLLLLTASSVFLVAKSGQGASKGANKTYRPPAEVDADLMRVVYNLNYGSKEDDGDNGSLDSGQEEFKSEVEKRLAALEENYTDLSGAQGDLEKSLKGYALSGHGGATMKVNGRIHADVWGFPGDSPGVNGFETGDVDVSPQDRVGFRRIRFGVKGDIPYDMVYKVEMEFAGGNESEIRDVYIGWNELPFLHTLLIGNQKAAVRARSPEQQPVQYLHGAAVGHRRLQPGCASTRHRSVR